MISASQFRWNILYIPAASRRASANFNIILEVLKPKLPRGFLLRRFHGLSYLTLSFHRHPFYLWMWRQNFGKIIWCFECWINNFFESNRPVKRSSYNSTLIWKSWTYFFRTTTSIKMEKCNSTLPLQEGIGLIFKSYFHMSLLFGDEINNLFFFCKITIYWRIYTAWNITFTDTKLISNVQIFTKEYHRAIRV